MLGYRVRATGTGARAFGHRGDTQPSSAASSITVNVDKDNVALNGYDPVSYFDAAQPLKGSPQITATDRIAIYRFTTEAHRALFLDDPKRYEPAYGGFCAVGVAHGYKVTCDPTDYKVEDGKLYLFNKNLLFDASAGWSAKQKQAADQNRERARGQ
jgi:hypothetical protein